MTTSSRVGIAANRFRLPVIIPARQSGEADKEKPHSGVCDWAGLDDVHNIWSGDDYGLSSSYPTLAALAGSRRAGKKKPRHSEAGRDDSYPEGKCCCAVPPLAGNARQARRFDFLQ
jgi:hypothetical protein